MNSDRVLIAAILFIVAVIAINYGMYIIARSWAKGDSRWISSLRNSLKSSVKPPADRSMEELRRKVEEIKAKKDAKP